MCSTRGGSQEMYITFASAMRIRQNHSGFETQRRRHQKSKNRGTIGPKIGHVNVSDKKKKKKKFHLRIFVRLRHCATEWRWRGKLGVWEGGAGAAAPYREIPLVMGYKRFVKGSFVLLLLADFA